MPPCGTIATPAAAQAETTAETSAVEPGRATAMRAAAEQPARLFEIGGDELGVDDDVGGADDTRELIEKGGSVVHPSGPLRRLTGRRRKAARSSTWGEKRNWSSAATGPIS